MEHRRKKDKKKLYSFYIDKDKLSDLQKLSGYMTTKSKRITVSKLMNIAIRQFIDEHLDAIESMDKLFESNEKEE